MERLMLPFTAIFVGFALIAAGFFGCGDCDWSPPVKPEDARLCAPAYYQNSCREALGYKFVCR
jgi:hypothetical protein